MKCFRFVFYSDMFIAAGEFVKAAEILGENGWTEKLVNVANLLPIIKSLFALSSQKN